MRTKTNSAWSADRLHALADVLARRAGLATLGDEKVRLAVRRSCLIAAPEAEERRHRRARADRHVTTRLEGVCAGREADAHTPRARRDCDGPSVADGGRRPQQR